MKHHYQSSVLVIAVAIVMVAASHPARADFGDQLAKLLPSDGAGNDEFGQSVAINGETAIVAVGAYLDDDNGDESGSAYLFDASSGAQIAKLLPTDGGRLDFFGGSIAIDNGVVAVGAHGDDDNGAESGSAYLFDASTGAQIAKLLPNDGATADLFGWPIAIDNGVVAVGAFGDDDNGAESGSVYLFDASTGAQIAKLLPNDGAADDRFGWSIAIDNGVVAVGAIWDDDNGDKSGSAYLFDASTGAQIAKLLPSDGAGGDWFGWSTAINNGVVAVGAYFDDDNGTDSGSAYLFDASTGTQIIKLLPNDGAAGDLFGVSIAIDNGVVAVGAIWDDDNGFNSGSAYLFDAGGSTGTPARLTSFRVLEGTLISGGLPRLRRSDDRYIESEARVTGEVSQPHLLIARVVAESDVQDPTEMVLTFESHITDVEGTVWLFLRNWRQGALVQVAQFNVGLADSVEQVTIPRARRFIRTSDGRIKLQIKKIVFFPFTLGGFHSLIDQVEMVVR